MIPYEPQSNKIKIEANVELTIKNAHYQIRVRTTIHSLLGLTWLKNKNITLILEK